MSSVVSVCPQRGPIWPLPVMHWTSLYRDPTPDVQTCSLWSTYGKREAHILLECFLVNEGTHKTKWYCDRCDICCSCCCYCDCPCLMNSFLDLPGTEYNKTVQTIILKVFLSKIAKKFVIKDNWQGKLFLSFEILSISSSLFFWLKF